MKPWRLHTIFHFSAESPFPLFAVRGLCDWTILCRVLQLSEGATLRRSVLGLRNCHILLIALLLNGLYLSAQLVEEDTSRNAPFFKSRKFDSKCYVEFNGSASQILKKEAAMSTGASLNWVVNHKLVVSAQYRVLTTYLNIKGNVEPDQPGNPIGLANEYAGLGFGYIFFNNKTFSLQPELAAGWADVKYKIGHANYKRSFGEIDPTVYGIYNATKYFRLGIGLNYHATVGCRANGLTDAYLSGIGGMLFIRVGTF